MTRGQQIAVYPLTVLTFVTAADAPWLLFPLAVAALVAWDAL